MLDSPCRGNRTKNEEKKMNFIEKIKKKEIDDSVHNQFIRFGKGVYEGRACLGLHITGKVKLSSSFEFANDFLRLILNLVDKVDIDGIVLSKERIDLENEEKKKGIFNYKLKKEIRSEELKEIIDKSYYCLLDLEAEGIKYKSKKKLPKPGKDAKKIDDKFCKLEADLKYKQEILKWMGLPECKKCKVKHCFEINQIVFPQGEQDPEKLRLNSKRKGKIKREMEIDKQTREEEFEFEA